MTQLRQRPVTHSLAKALRNVGAFSTLEDRTLLHILGLSSNLKWQAGSTIFEAGNEAEALYVVVSGETSIFDPADGREIVRFSSGDYFGEMSLMINATHSKTARAVTPCELLVLPKEPFQRLLQDNEDLERQVRGTMEARLEQHRR